MISQFINKDNYNIFYADINNVDDIIADFLGGKDYLGFQTKEELVEKVIPIDFVVTRTYKEAVDGMRFQSIFSVMLLNIQ